MAIDDRIAQLRRQLAKLADKDRVQAQQLLDTLAAEWGRADASHARALDTIHDVKNVLQMLLPTLERELPEEALQVIAPQLSKLRLQLNSPGTGSVTTTPIYALAEDMAAAYADAVHSSGLWLTIDYEQRIARTPLPAEPLFQVVNNLVLNAIENSQQGCLTLRFLAIENGIGCQITDEGYSIAERIQLPSDTPTPIVSERRTSRGLASLQPILQDHGWRLTIEPGNRCGTTATLLLPSHKPQAGKAPPAPLKHQSVLLVHDNLRYREWLRQQISLLGASVVHQERLGPSDPIKGYTHILYAPSAVFGAQLREELGSRADAMLLTPNSTPAACPSSPKSLRRLFASPETENKSKQPPLSLLLVEDEAFTAMAIQQQLGKYTLQVHHADSGLAALRQAQRLQPSIVLLDWQLQDVAAAEVAKRLHKAQPDTTVIVLSGYAAPNQLPEAVAGWLSKPLVVSQLWDLLKYTPPKGPPAATPRAESPVVTYQSIPPASIDAIPDSRMPALDNPQFAALLLPLLTDAQTALRRGEYTRMQTGLQHIRAYLKRTDWPAMVNRLKRCQQAVAELETATADELLREMQQLATHWLLQHACQST